MRYVFFGTPRFAAIVLGHLFDAGMPPAALVANPDRPVGRKKIITEPPTKMLVKERGGEAVTVFQPEALDDAFIAKLTALAPDFFVVAAYAKIIPDAVLKIPRLGTIGTHPSLLPKYRGASPIQSVILNGETETGVALYLMDAKMDNGPILAMERLAIADGESYPALEERLANLAGALLAKTIPDFTAGKLAPQAQDASQATFTKKFATEDGFIAAEELADAAKARTNFQKILALNPEPGVWTRDKDGKRVKLLEARIENGALHLTKTQKEGETPKAVSL